MKIPHALRPPIADVKRQLANDLAQLLSRDRTEITGPNSHDVALGVANQQSGRWQRLFSILNQHQLKLEAVIQNRLNLLVQLLSESASRASVSKKDEHVSVLAGDLPLLLSDPAENLIEKGKEFPLLCAVIIANRCQSVLLKSNNQHVVDWLLAANAIDAATAVDPNSKLSDIVNTRLSNLNAAVNERLGELETFKADIAQDIQHKQRDLVAKGQEIDELITALKSADVERNTSWDLERKDALQAMRNEVHEYVKIESSITLWKTKANWHTAIYILLSIFFGVSLIAIAGLFIFGFVTGFVDEVAKIPADHQFLGIAVLAIPTLAIAWLLRFIARLTIQNFALAHDARLRHAQISTYLRLLGDPKKPISENERILALAALFRPLPGQGPEDVNPPTIADLLKDAQKKIMN